MDQKEKDLQASLDGFKLQLGMVLEQVSTVSGNDDLQQLQQDLLELISLTEEELLTVKKQRLLAMVDNISSPKVTVQENPSVTTQHAGPSLTTKLCIESGAVSPRADDSDAEEDDDDESATEISPDELESLQAKLNELEGTKCRVAYSQDWGHHSTHNALVLHTEPIDIKNGSLKVRVVFCNPTHRNMLACSYYLDGSCRFDQSSCRYSHGHVVSVGDLLEYKEPDYSHLDVDSRCLARYEDGLWYPATVLEVHNEEQQCSVKFEAYPETVKLNVEHVLPLDDGGGSDSDSDTSDIVSAHDYSACVGAETRRPKQTTAKMGEWEQFTKGFGSKLMAKMGYVIGEGLGCRGQGRTEPVPIQLIPSGKSLDRIMELKELAGDGDIFDAMKQEKRKRKLVEKKAAEAYQKLEMQTDVFDFINKKIHKGKKGTKEVTKTQIKSATSTNHRVKNISERDLGQKSDKGLNVQLFKTQEEIKKVQAEINRIKDSMNRNQASSSFQTRACSKQASLEAYLARLQSSSSSIETHKQRRSDHKKLTVF